MNKFTNHLLFLSSIILSILFIILTILIGFNVLRVIAYDYTMDISYQILTSIISFFALIHFIANVLISSNLISPKKTGL